MNESSHGTLVHGEFKLLSLHAQQLVMDSRRNPYNRGYCTVLTKAANRVELVIIHS